MNLAQLIDHTHLKAQATEKDIFKLCKEAKEYNFYSVCVNPRWLKYCVNELKYSQSLPITVVGFPLGANDLSIKNKECDWCLENGAKEIDVVIDVSLALAGEWKKLEDEIKSFSKMCDRIPLKVIIETAYLNSSQIVEASKACLFGGARFVKTSTGFAPTGAKEEDIKLIRESVGPSMGIKASGGIKNLADAERMLNAGATRLGASASVEIVEEWKKNQSI